MTLSTTQLMIINFHIKELVPRTLNRYWFRADLKHQYWCMFEDLELHQYGKMVDIPADKYDEIMEYLKTYHLRLSGELE